jgi:biotin-(acetyl-CoA carboxylase) ligase
MASDNTLFSREYHGEVRKLKKYHPYKSLSVINHDVFYRIVENEETYLKELDNTYSLFIHNPNNSFEVIYNRLAMIGNDRFSLRDEHEKELERIRNIGRNNK